jgi:Ca-activated chloride channel family protein
MRRIRRMVSVVMISCMMAGCLAGCGSGKETGGTHGEQQGTESRSGTERESIAEKYRQKTIKEEFEENIAESGQEQKNMAVPECIEEGACDSAVSAADTYNSVMDSASNSEYVKIGYGESGYDTREYDYQEEHRFVSTKDFPLSTFAADCDTASYSNIRSYIEEGTLPPAGAVRVEEMINYFDYDYVSDPEAGKKFAVYTEYSDCPWNKDTKLMMVGLNTAAIDMSEKKASNLVFLIDTSGSMYEENKLPLAQKAFKMLAENLDENDRISIVTYAGSDTVVLNGVAGSEPYTICEALDSLEASGSTNGSAGLITAYEIAEQQFIKDGNNRVILATDGDLNVGLTSESDLVGLITEEKDSGIFLSVLGFGSDNLKDNKLEALADHGNGNYSYLDSVYEAKKVLVDEMGGTLYTVAKDVKMQIEFNPEQVKGYRQIGYENRALSAEDFADDTVDGGEIGAGHVVTALYEVVPVDSEFDVPEAETKYTSKKQSADYSGELATVNIRYKEPDGDKSTLETAIIKAESGQKEMSHDLSFASAVAVYGMLLTDSAYKGTATYKMVEELAEAGITVQTDERNMAQASNDQLYRSQFLELVRKTEKIPQREPAAQMWQCD